MANASQCGLKELGLNNQIGDSGAQALANALPQCGLKDLYLSSNQIGDQQALANASAVGLTYLYLSSNRIGDSVKSKLRKMREGGSNPV